LISSNARLFAEQVVAALNALRAWVLGQSHLGVPPRRRDALDARREALRVFFAMGVLLRPLSGSS
jgi:hypothetical protein